MIEFKKRGAITRTLTVTVHEFEDETMEMNATFDPEQDPNEATALGGWLSRFLQTESVGHGDVTVVGDDGAMPLAEFLEGERTVRKETGTVAELTESNLRESVDEPLIKVIAHAHAAADLVSRVAATGTPCPHCAHNIRALDNWAKHLELLLKMRPNLTGHKHDTKEAGDGAGS